MASKIMSIAAFAALAMAIPNHPEHMGRSNIAREVSYDGTCGSWSGATCPGSECCSAEGWCGSSDTHCGTGCQAGFGNCSGGSNPIASIASSAAASSLAASSVTAPNFAASSVAPPEQSAPAVEPPTQGSSSPAPVAPQPTGQAPVAESGSSSAKAHKTTKHTVTTYKTSAESAASTSTAANRDPGLPGNPGLPHSESARSSAEPTHLTVSKSISSAAASATPSSSSSTNTTSGSGADKYTEYKGDGSAKDGWPSMDQWVGEFEAMWQANLPNIGKCGPDMNATESADPNGPLFQKDNTDAETATLKQAIIDNSKASGVDSRFALAIMMQETKGCVRVHTTSWDGSVQNPGVYQDHDGEGTCYNYHTGPLPVPCPDSNIKQMAKDGIDGTTAGDGLKQVIATGQKGETDKSQGYYKAARIYNSGSIDSSNNLEAGIATHCYSSDVANRLTGWVSAKSDCTFDTK